jgi:Glycosyltransferase family 87
MGTDAFRRPPALDALLYGSSAVIALQMSASAELERNRLWAEVAWPAYAAGGIVALVLARLAARLGHDRLSKARLLLALCVLAGAVAVPLAKEVRWRADGAGNVRSASLHPFATSEVVVTEGAAAALLRGRNPYSAHFDSPELAGRLPGIPEHFPYLPGMAVFGLPGALLPHRPWTDARVFLALATGLAAAAALLRWRAPPGRRLRALQVLVILPTGAPALAAGVNDMPVLALSLLALVLLERGRHLASAVAVALAALLKVTAWPLLLALAVTARAGDGRRGLRSPFLVAPALVVAAVVAAAAAGPAAFADDVLLFPAGLSSLPSPAASTTVGSTLVGILGSSPNSVGRFATTRALLAVASVAVAAALILLARSRSGGHGRAAEPAAAAGLMLLTLVLLAPVARVGYFVYPIDLLLWALLLRPADRSPAPRPSPVAAVVAG